MPTSETPKSPAPTAVGAAVATRAARRRWLSFGRYAALRLFKLNTPVLALVFGLVLEGLFIGAFQIWRDTGGVGSPSNLSNQLFEWFHLPARECLWHFPGRGMEHPLPAYFGIPLFLLVAVSEWWLIFFTAILLMRHFTKKPV